MAEGMAERGVAGALKLRGTYACDRSIQGSIRGVGCLCIGDGERQH